MITEFHKDTPEEVKRILQEYCHTDKRLRLFYGDTQTGRDWGEENYAVGYVGNSMGPSKIPLLIANKRSMGGGGILDNCIVRMIDAGSKREVYRHPLYNQPKYTVGDCPAMIGKVIMCDEGYTHGVYANGENVANFKSEIKARNWIAFMCGERMSR